MSEFPFNLNGNLRIEAHWKLGPVFLWGSPQGNFGKSPQGVQIPNRISLRKSQTITDLKEAIREEMWAIHRSVCKDVKESFVRQVKKCTEPYGGHLERTL